MLTGLDLFAGAGGATQGLKDAGYRLLAADEKCADAVRTFSVNHPEVQVLQRDILRVDRNGPAFVCPGSCDDTTGGPAMEHRPRSPVLRLVFLLALAGRTTLRGPGRHIGVVQPNRDPSNATHDDPFGEARGIEVAGL